MSGFFTDQLPPTDPNVQQTDERRLSKQNRAILARLREGPANNSELAAFALKYTSRVSDLRKHGYAVKCYKKRGDESGVRWYRLIAKDEQ